MRLLAFVALLIMALCSAYTEEKDTTATYGVVFTTIPSRMKSLHHVIDSWISQRQITPTYIFIMVPQKYKRFKRKSSGSSGSNDVSFKEVVETQLYRHYYNPPLIAGEQVVHSYKDRIHLLHDNDKLHAESPPPPHGGDNGDMSDTSERVGDEGDEEESDERVVIHVCETAYDDGPALKYSGLFQLVDDWQRDGNAEVDIGTDGSTGNDKSDGNEMSLASLLMASQYAPPQHWIVCDDDVTYMPDTLSKYYFSQHVSTPLSSSSADPAIAPQTPLQLERTVLTHFSEDYRIILKLREEPFKRPMMQIQGVDTVLIPHALLIAHATGESAHYPSLHVEKFRILLSYIHQLCPSSFYQDDYLISFTMNIGNTDIRSIWNSENVAKHVDGLSKQYHQMHMSKMVHDREADTRQCLMEYADEIIEHVFS